jgi:hypothetical protein
MYVLVIITIASVNPAPTSVVTITGFKSLNACTNAGKSLVKYQGINYECVKVK